MAEDLNVHTITGNLVADPEGRDYGSGDNSGRVVEFRVACNRRAPRGGGDSTADFFTVKAFNGLGRLVEEHLAKGRKVLVMGRHQIDVVDSTKNPGTKQYFQSIVADKVQFLDRPPESGSGGGQQAAPASAGGSSDVPF